MRVTQIPFRPSSFSDTSQLLKFVSKTLVFKKRYKDKLTYNQMASLVFGIANEETIGHITKLTHLYPRYIIKDYPRATKFMVDIDSINEDWPEFADETLSEDPLDKILNQSSKEITPSYLTEKRYIEEMHFALDDEIVAAREDRVRNTYRIKRSEILNVRTTKGVWDLYLEIEKDEFIKAYEGMPVNIVKGPKSFQVEVLQFDSNNSILTIHSGYDLSPILSKGKSKVVFDAEWLLWKVKEGLDRYNPGKSFPIKQLMQANHKVKQEIGKDVRLQIGTLDRAQKDALVKALNNNITLIWGPPGTGKSYALAHYLVNALIRRERVLVCCIANVAVDAITKALIKVLIDFNQSVKIEFRDGQILRVGHTRDNELLKRDYLFPNSPHIADIRSRIDVLNSKINNEKNQNLKKQQLSQITDLKTRLAELIRQVISEASIVFATASKIHTDSIFHDLEFDNLVIDEASMMSVPHFVVLANKICKRLIICGDFRQLGPVVLSHSNMSEKWLHQDLFEFTGLNYVNNNLDHTGLAQLKTQRRYHTKICNLINDPFYNGSLITANVPGQSKLVRSLPAAERSIAYYNLSGFSDFQCQRTRKYSRYNKFSAQFVYEEILNKLPKQIDPYNNEIGIITPYRGQVNEIQQFINRGDLPDTFKKKIKVGTIHSFQGSEADILIFDLVESKHLNVGRLYLYGTGARLVNVAVSRAKSKLLVVGDIEAILDNDRSNNVDPKTKKVFRSLKKYNYRFV